MYHIIALSGGKDSTALALRLNEVEPRDYLYVVTPTGDELPEVLEHWKLLENLLGKPFTYITNKTLNFWIDTFRALPKIRQRWCTRLLKIEPVLAYIKRLQQQDQVIMYVGLRADELHRKGIYSEEISCRFPLREWGWTKASVWNYLREQNIVVPARTDCARCYAQTILQWKQLWRNYPAVFAEAEQQEAVLNKTFRTPNKGDGWPTSLSAMRKEFENGRIAPREKDPTQETLFDTEFNACRVCSL